MDHLTQSDIIELLQSAEVGKYEHDLPITSIEQSRIASINMARQAFRTIHIVSHNLDERVYSNHDFVRAVAQLAMSGKHAMIQILVKDTDPLVHHGHLLIETMRRLSTYIHLRKIHDDIIDMTQAYMIVDERGLILHRVATRYEGVVRFNAPRDCRELIKSFKEIWRKCEPDSRLRRLHI